MKKLFLLPTTLVIASLTLHSQHVGIGTLTPRARLHVADSAVIFTGQNTDPFFNNEFGDPPTSGAGTRLMWYPQRAAFRAGYAYGIQWDKEYLGLYSFATGHSTTASGMGSFAAGRITHATGTNAMAMGYGSEATNSTPVALGSFTTASGASSFATGDHTKASGPYSFAAGSFSEATGNTAYAHGGTSYASGDFSTAMGLNSVANSAAQVTIGMYNTIIAGANPISAVPTDPLFQIGNGSGEFSRNTALLVRKDGYVGINTILPQARLHTVGNQITEGNLLVKRNSSMGAAHITLTETGTNDGARLQFRTESIANRYWEVYGLTDAINSADATFNIYYDGVGNNMMLRGNGNVWFRGTMTQNSDVNLKKNIRSLEDPLQKLMQINGYNYQWKDVRLDQGLQSGVLAQEIEQWMPELVNIGPDGTRSVNYIGLIPYLVEAIKKQQAMIEELQRKR